MGGQPRSRERRRPEDWPGYGVDRGSRGKLPPLLWLVSVPMNEPTMTQQEAWTYLNGGAEPGSMKHEEAKAALAWHQQQEASTQREASASAMTKWTMIGALSTALGVVVALVALVR